MKIDQWRPLSAQDREPQILGCRHSKPDICKNNSTPNKCASVRSDEICLTPPRSWKKIFEKLKSESTAAGQGHPDHRKSRGDEARISVIKAAVPELGKRPEFPLSKKTQPERSPLAPVAERKLASAPRIKRLQPDDVPAPAGVRNATGRGQQVAACLRLSIETAFRAASDRKRTSGLPIEPPCRYICWHAS